MGKHGGYNVKHWGYYIYIAAGVAFKSREKGEKHRETWGGPTINLGFMRAR